MCLSGHMLWPEVATRRPSPARDSPVTVEPLHRLFRNLTPRAAGPSAGLAATGGSSSMRGRRALSTAAVGVHSARAAPALGGSARARATLALHPRRQAAVRAGPGPRWQRLLRVGGGGGRPPTSGIVF
eukprot:scaffold396_cov339-Prasinococcus_capsulatus_cf.AAC.21